MKLLRICALLSVLAIAGCRSRVVQVTLVNTSQQPVSTVVVDYPGATFGVDKLEPGKSFRYAIKPLDTGELKIQFADARGISHNYSGPTLHKNDEGAIEVRLDQDTARPELHLNARQP